MRTGTKIGIAAAVVVILVAIVVWRIEAVSARILETHYPAPAKALAVSPAQGPVRGPIQGNVANGERVARLAGCFGCHGRELTGRQVFSGPFGTRIVSPNLTLLAHRLSDAQLATGIRYGVRPDGTSAILMPSSHFVGLSDSDIADLIAFLRSLPEKPSAAGRTQWGFGGKAMLAMGMFPVSAKMVDPAAHGPAETPGEPIALGRYIASAYCSACHGPDLSGDPQLDSPDLRQAVTHYSVGEFAHFFATGEGRKGQNTQRMSGIIRRQLKYLTPAEVGDVYAYLTALKPKTQGTKDADEAQ